MDDPAGNVRPFAVTVEGAFEADVLDYSDRPGGDGPSPAFPYRPLLP